MGERSETERGPLTGLRVLEIGGTIAAAACTRLLRGFGAATSRVTPDGDDLDTDESIFYLTGGDQVDLDPADPHAQLASLVAEADIVIEDRTPGWMSAAGLDPVALRQDRPGLIITSVTPFGQTGPHAHWQTTSAVQFAVGGIMTLTGDPDRPPLVTAGDQAFVLGGLNGFATTTIAALAMLRTGRGEWIDISMQECAASMMELYAAQSEYDLQEPLPRSGNSVRASWGVYPCADGWAGVCCLGRQLPALFELIGEPVVSDERWHDAVLRAEHNDELLAHVMGFMADHTKSDLLALSPVHRVPFGAVRTPAEVLVDPGLADRGFFDHVNGPDGQVTMPGRPFPGLGWQGPHSDAAQIATGPDERDQEIWRDRPLSGSAQRPLEGVRILDLTMMWAGPYATKLLAEMGADVVKVESPSAWDNIRTLIPQDPAIPDPWNSSYYFNEYNHSKRSLTLDLAHDEGRALFLQLVETADVVLENYRADVLDKLGLDYATLRSANEAIVLVSMAGFGKTGPHRDHVGFGPIIEMMSGLMSLTGYGDHADPEADPPFKTGISYGDPVGGLHAVSAIALSLIRRDRTGAGIHVDLAQLETLASMAGPTFAGHRHGGVTGPPVHRGNRSDRLAPQGCYRASGDDAWVVISIRDDTDWGTVCELLDRSDLAALDLDQRRARHDELDEVIEAWTAERTPATVAQALQDLGVPAGVVNDTLGIHDDPHLVDRGYYVTVPHEKMHPYRQTGPTWRLADAPAHVMRRSPLFGEHNLELLADELGLDGDRLARLRESAVIADAPIDPTIG